VIKKSPEIISFQSGWSPILHPLFWVSVFLFSTHGLFDLGVIGPTGTLSYLQYFRKFMGRYAALGGVDKEDHIKGLGDRDPGILKNGKGNGRFIIAAPGTSTAEWAATRTIMVVSTPATAIVHTPFQFG